MYYGIDITEKTENGAVVYRATPYAFRGVFVNTVGICAGWITLKERGENLTEIYGILFHIIEGADKCAVINECADMLINERCGLSAFIAVFNDGEYSHKDTLSIKNDRHILFAKEEEINNFKEELNKNQIKS